MAWAPIVKRPGADATAPALDDYDRVRTAFTWATARAELDGLPEGRGLNIAHEAVDRHAAGPRGDRIALRWLGKTADARDYTYREMRELTDRFANVLDGMAAAKLQSGFGQAVLLGILCNVLVCLAVWLSYSARSTTDRVLAVVPPIAAFVAAGFEHSVANMYFVPFALFLTHLDPGFVAARGLDAHTLTWGGFLGRNLLPVTIGNIIGGAVLVGGVYWFVYLLARVEE